MTVHFADEDGIVNFLDEDGVTLWADEDGVFLGDAPTDDPYGPRLMAQICMSVLPFILVLAW